MAVGADFARLPTRQKVMIFVLIGGLLGAVYWQFVYKGLKEDLATEQGLNDSKKAQNAKLEKDIPAFEKLLARVRVLQRIIEENQKALPTEAELPAFFETLNRKVLESGVEVVRSRQLKEEPIEAFIRVPVEYEIVGTFVQIKKFFASLVPKKKRKKSAEPVPGEEVEERERIVSIENLSLTNPVVRNRELHLTAKFTASTYRMENRKEIEIPGAAKPATPPGGAAKAGVDRIKGGL